MTINKENKFWKFIIQVIKFGITGACSTVISLAFYYLFLSLSIDKYIANTLSFLCGTVFGYLVNNLWVFKPEIRRYSMVWKFYTVYICSYLMSQGLLFLWVDVLTISEKIAPLINLLFTIPFNFFLSRFWVFKVKKAEGENKLNHTFVLCAYKESPYLETCLKSLVDQEVKSNIIIATSTPNDYIYNIAKKYGIEVFVNEGESGIWKDWNFGVSCAKTDFVTICHHDDYYKPNYYKQIEAIINSSVASQTALIHTGYYDVDENGKECITKNNVIKRLLLWPAGLAICQSARPIKKALLSLGNTVCCPSCTYNKKILGENFYNSELTFCVDWEMYYKIASMKGRIIYVPDRLMAKRFHSESQTTLDQLSGKREKEDIIMFKKMWPNFMVKIIMKFYKKAYSINVKK